MASFDVHVQGRAGRYSFLLEQVTSRIRAIIISGDEAGLVDYLSGEAAQTFIDVVHEVCLRVKRLAFRKYPNFFFYHLNLNP